VENVALHRSPAPDKLPEGIGQFDFVIFSAVYEHLLPDERQILLPLIWGALKPGGVLFLNGTPHRYFPYESHTTGLPFINYLPDGATAWVSRRFSGRNLRDDSWPVLLRKGIRGGSIPEIMGILRRTADGSPSLLRPDCMGVNDRIDLWYQLSTKNIDGSHRPVQAKRAYRLVAKAIKMLTGAQPLPELALAIRKA
jgi:SAM-dependent methyltransferase